MIVDDDDAGKNKMEGRHWSEMPAVTSPCGGHEGTLCILFFSWMTIAKISNELFCS